MEAEIEIDCEPAIKLSGFGSYEIAPCSPDLASSRNLVE